MSKKTKILELHFSDLNEEFQKKLLEFYGIKKPEDMNWDIIPIEVYELEQDYPRE